MMPAERVDATIQQQRRDLAWRCRACLRLAGITADGVASARGFTGLEAGSPIPQASSTGAASAAAAAARQAQDAEQLLAELDALIDPLPDGMETPEAQELRWQRLVRSLWRREACRWELDRDPGLTTALRRAQREDTPSLIGGLFAARLQRPGEVPLCCLSAGRLWISDERWDELIHAWEPPWMDPGAISGGVPDHDAAARRDLQGLRRCWEQAAGHPPARAYLMHARHLGGVPASGFDLNESASTGAVVNLCAALRAHADHGPCLVQAAPQLLPWVECGDADGFTQDLPGDVSSRWRRYGQERAQDPVGALRRLLRSGPATPVGSAHAALAQVLRHAITERCGCGSACGGSWCIPFPAQSQLPEMHLRRDGEHLLVESSGLCSLIVALGWFPPRFRISPRTHPWSFATLSACGWHELTRFGCWRLRRLERSQLWIELPGPAATAQVPRVQEPPSPWLDALPGSNQLPLSPG
jgi:hypothetical protein